MHLTEGGMERAVVCQRGKQLLVADPTLPTGKQWSRMGFLKSALENIGPASTTFCSEMPVHADLPRRCKLRGAATNTQPLQPEPRRANDEGESSAELLEGSAIRELGIRACGEAHPRGAALQRLAHADQGGAGLQAGLPEGLRVGYTREAEGLDLAAKKDKVRRPVPGLAGGATRPRSNRTGSSATESRSLTAEGVLDHHPAVGQPVAEARLVRPAKYHKRDLRHQGVEVQRQNERDGDQKPSAARPSPGSPATAAPPCSRRACPMRGP